MRTLFIILFIANLVLFGIGQGLFGTARSQLGRTSELKIPSQINADAITFGAGQFQAR